MASLEQELFRGLEYYKLESNIDTIVGLCRLKNATRKRPLNITEIVSRVDEERGVQILTML